MVLWRIHLGSCEDALTGVVGSWQCGYERKAVRLRRVLGRRSSVPTVSYGSDDIAISYNMIEKSRSMGLRDNR